MIRFLLALIMIVTATGFSAEAAIRYGDLDSRTVSETEPCEAISAAPVVEEPVHPWIFCAALDRIRAGTHFIQPIEIPPRIV